MKHDGLVGGVRDGGEFSLRGPRGCLPCLASLYARRDPFCMQSIPCSHPRNQGLTRRAAASLSDRARRGAPPETRTPNPLFPHAAPATHVRHLRSALGRIEKGNRSKWEKALMARHDRRPKYTRYSLRLVDQASQRLPKR
jgi:hypothetical protein